jgi:hypothetical protein
MLGDYSDSEGCELFPDSLEGLKQASASLGVSLKGSSSTACLLPCGLLPEELEELESFSSTASLPQGQLHALRYSA